MNTIQTDFADEREFFKIRCKSYLDQDMIADDSQEYVDTDIDELISCNESIYVSEHFWSVDKKEDTIIAFCKYVSADFGEFKEKIGKIYESTKGKTGKTKITKIYLITYLNGIERRIRLSSIINEFNSKSKYKILFKPVNRCNYRGAHIEFDVERFDLLQMPPVNGAFSIQESTKEETDLYDGVTGYVFTSPLSDLIQMYNIIGDELFDRNVRYKIGDVLNVDSEIKKTLRTHPQDFWFFNNGITIYIEGKRSLINNSQKIVLAESIDTMPPRFSVINGAQTLSTASECYYSLSDSEEDKKIKENIDKKAKVLVRIIEVPSDKESKPDQIAIALNRQKPIKTEDIAYTVPFVTELNRFAEENKKKLRIVKRGEARSPEEELDLVTFAKICKAAALKPQDARNSSASTLLEQRIEKSGIRFFINKELHCEEFHIEEKQEEIYSKYFEIILPINSLVRTYEEYIRTNRTTMTKERVSFLVNAKWFFVSYVLWNTVNDLENGDYSGVDILAISAACKDTARVSEIMNFFAEKLEGINSEKQINYKGEILFKKLTDGDKDSKYSLLKPSKCEGEKEETVPLG